MTFFSFFDQKYKQKKLLDVIESKLGVDMEEACRLFFSFQGFNDSKDNRVLSVKANLFVYQGKLEQAKNIYDQLIHENKNSGDLWLGLGNVEQLLGNYKGAINSFKQAVTLHPENPLLWLSMAESYWAEKDVQNALRCANKVVSLDSESARGHCLLGHIRGFLEDVELAEVSFRRALRLDASYLKALQGLALILFQEDRLEDAEEALFNTYDTPITDELYVIQAEFYFAVEKYSMAENKYLEGVSCYPDSFCLWQSYGVSLRNIGKVESAVRAFSKALELKPGDGLVTWHLSLCYFLQGQFDKAWDGYEKRRICPDTSVRDSPTEEWKGQELNGKQIFIFSEQGIGDEIMFACCIPKLLSETNGATLECNGKLLPIFTRSFPECKVVKKTSNQLHSSSVDFTAVDYSIPIGSLPKYFLAYQDWVGRIPPYLKADSSKARVWKQRLSSLGDGLKIGLSWRGGVKQTRSKQRSIELKTLLRAFEGLEVILVNLQYGDTKAELDELSSAGRQVHHWQQAIDDYDETAALASSLDLVVSVQTALVHLAGAMGVKVWALIPYGAEWRYGSENEKMVWYKDVTLIRQSELGEWDDPLSQLSKRLQKLIET